MAWYNVAWQYREKITIASSGYGMTADQTDFTHRVSIVAANTTFWASVKSDGADVRFTASDGTTLLKFEVESFDSTGDDAHYHVKIPTLGYAANTDIYIYYGNAAATSGEDITNSWDSSYSAVWHLNQDKTAGAFADSTVNALALTNISTTDGVGKIDNGRTFVAASSQRIKVPINTLLSPVTSKFAVESWFKTSSAGAQYIFDSRGAGAVGARSVASQAIAATSGRLYCIFISNAGAITLTLYPTDNYADGTFHHIVTVLDGTTAYLYVDGVQKASETNASFGTCTLDNTSEDLHSIGATNSINYFDGIIDETTVSKGATVRSVSWVKARYNSGLGTGLTFATEEEGPIAYASPLIGTFAMPAVTIPTYVAASPLIGTFNLPASTVVSSIKVLADALVGTFAMPDVIAGKSVVAADPLTGAFVIAVPTVALPVIVAISPLSGTFAILDPYVVAAQKSILFGAYNFPNSKTVSYKVVDDAGVIIQNWTTVGVTETVLDTVADKSVYTVRTNKVNENFQGQIMWKTSDAIPLTAVEIINIYSSYVDILQNRLTAQRAVNLDDIPTRLATASYTAPDNAGIAALPTLAEIEASTVLAKQAKLDFMEKWVLNKLVESADSTIFTLYDDDGVTPLKTWPYTSASKTRGKAT